jgi:hypothetical protein
MPDIDQPLGLLVDAARIDPDDRQPLARRGLVRDQLSVSPDPALRSSEVQEADALEPSGMAQSVYPSWRSRSPASVSMSAISDG